MNKAYVISTGTEMMLGLTLDTNGAFIARNLTDLGFDVIGHCVVCDHEDDLYRAFAAAWKDADLVVASGGLGPTLDDLTKPALCAVLQKELVLREEEAEWIRGVFKKRKRTMPENNLRQAFFPSEAHLLNNRYGTASGMYLTVSDKMAVLLPGPPREMEPMFKNELVPVLKENFNLEANAVVRKTIKVFGPGESQVETLLAPVIDNAENFQLSFLAVEGEVHIKIAAEGGDRVQSLKIMEETAAAVGKHMGESVFGYDDDTLVQAVSGLLRSRRLTVALAESCTGGLLAKMLTDYPDSSDFFWGAAIVYSNEAKMKCLGVSEQTLQEHGAVSSETAQEMARNLLNFSGADLALSITGVAGPGGGSEEKPVGLVYIGWADQQGCYAKELQFLGDRDSNRLLAAKSALDILRRQVKRR